MLIINELLEQRVRIAADARFGRDAPMLSGQLATRDWASTISVVLA